MVGKYTPRLWHRILMETYGKYAPKPMETGLVVFNKPVVEKVLERELTLDEIWDSL